jgi:4-hydroxy-3-methylbut-2-en-1-yl diphosphate reductase
MEVYLAQPRGFCAGVVRAIEIVERALVKYGPPVYVRHEIVHNKYVVESLKAKGAIFVEDLSEVPPLAVTVFSAHGVARSVEEEAAARACPSSMPPARWSPRSTIRASGICPRAVPWS